MSASDSLEDRLARLREEWPAPSLVEDVMNRIEGGKTAPACLPAGSRRYRRPFAGRLFAGLVSSGLLLAMGVAWLILVSRPTTLLAAIQNDLKNAQSAHLVIMNWSNQDVPIRSEIWYRRNVGLRVESPDQVYLEDGKTQWTWSTKPADGERVVLRQKSPGFFTNQLPQLLTLPDVSKEWTKVRSPDLDREIHGRKCQASTLILANGAAVAPGELTRPKVRGIVLAEPEGRIHEITVEEERKDGTWRRTHQYQIDYDRAVPDEKIEAKLPEGMRVVDRTEAFFGRHPLDKALKRIEIEGLIFAVHDIQPLKNGDGYYVVSSVQGSDEFLKAFPPKARPLNPELVLLDVAFQPMSNMSQGSKYIRVVLGSAHRDGVEYSWWLVMPRRFFQMKDGKRIELPQNDQSGMEGEPGRIDNLPGKARVPLMATFWDEKHRDARGVSKQVSRWVEVPVPADRPAADLDVVAGRARRDLQVMSVASAGGLLGVAADARVEPNTLRPMSRILTDVSDAEFAAAVQRGIDDFRQLDQVKEIDPAEMFPPGGKKK